MKILFVRQCQRGATALEYALLTSLIALVALATIGSTGQIVSDKFTEVGDSLHAANDNDSDYSGSDDSGCPECVVDDSYDNTDYNDGILPPCTAENYPACDDPSSYEPVN